MDGGSRLGLLFLLGALCIFIAVVLLVYRLLYGEVSEFGEMEVEIGKFKGPIWFLLLIFGVFLMIIDYSFVSPFENIFRTILSKI